MDSYTTNQDTGISFNSQISESAYQQHAIFEALENYVEFYDSWSIEVFSFVTMGTKAICNMDSYVFSSIKGTLCSIKMVLRDGRINDAWALLRKYNESIIINIYSNLFLKDNFRIDNFIVEQINGWISGQSSLPEYRVMSQYIRNHKEIHELNSLLHNHDGRYKEIRNRCNDHTHYNFFKNMLINDNELLLTSRISHLNLMHIDIRDLFILHIANMFCIREHYMASSDHLDYLECGEDPPEGSQYWVAPFIQETFNDVLTQFRPDIAKYLKNNGSMQLE